MKVSVPYPLIPMDYPDPDVIRVGDTFYLVSTTMHMMPGAEILKSTDLVNWEHASYVYDVLDETKAQKLEEGQSIYGQGMWAASLRHHQGVFYVLFAMNDTRKTYLYQSETIEGPWKKQVVEGFYHDASLYFEGNRAFLAYGNTQVYLTELNDTLTGPKENGLHRLLVEENNPQLGFEGAHLYKIKGYYYLFLIHSLSTHWKRTEACFRSTSLTGVFEGGDCLNDDRGYHNQGIAQGGIVDTPEGEWFALLFQDYGAVGRVPVLVPVTFKDDWPVFGHEGKVPEAFEVETKDAPKDTLPLVDHDDFAGKWDTPFGLKPQWQFNHQPDTEGFEYEPGEARFKLKSLAPGGFLSTKNTLTVRTHFPRAKASVTIDASNLEVGDVAGLGLLQGDYAYVGIKRTDSGYQLLMARKHNDETNESIKDASAEDVTEIVEFTSPLITLKAEVNFQDMKDTAQFYFEDDKKEQPIGAIHQLAFKLDHFMGARFALFLYSEKKTGGEASFQNFSYER